MRPIALALIVAGVAACSDAQGQQRPKAPVDQQLVDIKNELEAKLWANNCNYDPSRNKVCRNFKVVCALENPATPADRANGIARRITFWTTYIAQGRQNYAVRIQEWRDVREYITIHVRPDGTWQGVFAGDGRDPDPANLCRTDEARVTRF